MGAKVSLGMPVFNAERFIKEALESIVKQSFEDFELVISDNCSTDNTEAICREYASGDERIRYFRQRANYGVVHNFNAAFRLTSGEYFKWAAADDVCGRDYLLRCVEVLDQDPTVVLAWPTTKGIDENGEPAVLFNEVSDLNSANSTYAPDPVVRFRRLMQNMWWVDGPFYGLTRASVLSRTSLHPHHYSGDQILIAELALLGRFYEVPEELFFSRTHSQKTSRVKTLRERAELVYGKSRPGMHLRPWTLVWGYPHRLLLYAKAIERSPLTRAQKIQCYREVLRTIRWWMGVRSGRVVSRLTN